MAPRTWLITGVSSGFGRELTQQLLDRGDRVVGTVRDRTKVTDLLDKYPDTFHAELLDVTDTAAIREVVDRTLNTLRTRVADFETQRALAASTDFPPGD